MHILVTLKQVHDPNTPVDFLSTDGTDLSFHSATSFVLNAYDANAIEAAVVLKEKTGAKITVISLGGTENVAHLRRAIAMGADAGVLVKDVSGIDAAPMATAEMLAAAVARLDPVDLVLCGRQASDTDAGQTLFYLAEALGMTAVSPAVALEAESDGVVRVGRLADSGVQQLRVALPAVIGVSNELNRPRSPGLKGVMLSKKAQIPEWTSSDFGITTPSAGLERIALTTVVRPTIKAEVLAGESGAQLGRALADRLKSEGYF